HEEQAMAGYRDTLNLPRTEFPMKADLANREPARLTWWKERGSYAELRRRRAGRPVWLLHDGPPYSNNHLHMGTAANKIWKDACVRQASLLGFDSPYVPGWDNHGMPIENEVSKEFRKKGEKPDKVTMRKRCREYAAGFVEKQKVQFKRLGVRGDWDNPYLTMSTDFEAKIVEVFGELAQKGYIYRGLKPVLWCAFCETALADAEVEYEQHTSNSIYVRFPVEHDPNEI